MNSFNSFLLFNAIAIFILGSMAYQSKKRHSLNKIWGILSLVLFFWLSTMFMALFVSLKHYSLIWFRIANLILIFFPPLFLHLILVFLDELYKSKKILRFVYGLSTVLFILAIILPENFIKKVTPKLSFQTYPVTDWLYNFFIAIFTIVVTYGFYRLLKRFLGKSEFKRNQARYIFIGWVFGIAGIASFFPLSLGIAIYPLGNYFILTFALITSYAIAKHHLMDIDMVINKAVVFAYLIGLILLSHTGLVYLFYKKLGFEYAMASFASAGAILLILVLFIRFKDTLNIAKKLNDIIYGSRYHYKRVIEKLNKMAMVTFDFDSLINYIIEILVNNLGVSQISILLIDKHRGLYEIRASSGLPKEVVRNFSLPSNSELVTWLKKHYDTFALDNTKKRPPEEGFKVIAKDLKGLETTRSIPLFYKKELLGILNLGEKKDGKPFNQEEMDIINSFVKQIVIHIKNALLYEDSITDGLTKLFHHEYFYHRLKEEIDRVKRYQHPLSLFMMDIDHFKNYNDMYGHQAGDKVLKEIANLLRANVRNVDIVARYGGEEFCVIAPETNRKGAELLAERIRRLVLERTSVLQQEEEQTKKHFRRKSRGAKGISISIGVSVFERSEQDLDRHRFIKQADEALYIAKNKGGNKTIIL